MSRATDRLALLAVALFLLPHLALAGFDLAGDPAGFATLAGPRESELERIHRAVAPLGEAYDTIRARVPERAVVLVREPTVHALQVVKLSQLLYPRALVDLPLLGGLALRGELPRGRADYVLDLDPETEPPWAKEYVVIAVGRSHRLWQLRE